MTIYLDNPICQFQVLKNENILKNGNVNIVSATFFKMKKHYKNFYVYLNGIRKLVNFVDTDPKFYLVLFIDKNIYNDKKIMQIINNGKKTIPILYKCTEYMENGYHVDLFGTLVRFFPIFDFGNNPFNIVIITDIDVKDEDYPRLKTLLKHDDLPNGFIASSGFTSLASNERAYILAGRIRATEKYDKNIIINFIKNAHLIKDKGAYGERITPFGFGVDEVFINNILIPIIKNYGIMIEYHIGYFLYHYKSKILNDKTSDKIFDTILGKYAKSGMTVEEKYKFIDDNTYLSDGKGEIISYLSDKFYFVLSYLIEKNIEWLPINLMKFIIENFKNVNVCNAFIMTNINAEIGDVHKNDVVYLINNAKISRIYRTDEKYSQIHYY